MSGGVHGRSGTFMECKSQERSEPCPVLLVVSVWSTRRAGPSLWSTVRGADSPIRSSTRPATSGSHPSRNANGKVGRPTGRTRAAAEASRDRHIAAEREAGKFTPLAGGFGANTNVNELSRWWLDHVARHRVRVTTWSTYGKQLRVVGAQLGETAVRALRPEQVAALIADIAQAGSPSRARNTRMLLVQLLDEAVNLGLAEDNVARRVRSPRVPKVQRRTLTPSEVTRLLDVCDERYAAVVALCLVQGWRVSEALGLAWQDLDLEAGTVRLRRGATYADRVGMVLGSPKTSRTAGRQLLAPTTLRLNPAGIGGGSRVPRVRAERAASRAAHHLSMPAPNRRRPTRRRHEWPKGAGER